MGGLVGGWVNRWMGGLVNRSVSGVFRGVA